MHCRHCSLPRPAQLIASWRSSSTSTPRESQERHSLRWRTSDIIDRVGKHKAKAFPGFTERYGVDQLVHFEIHASAQSAIVREKQLKKWNRAWKRRLIEESNPRWEDLYDAICQ